MGVDSARGQSGGGPPGWGNGAALEVCVGSALAGVRTVGVGLTTVGLGLDAGGWVLVDASACCLVPVEWCPEREPPRRPSGRAALWTVAGLVGLGLVGLGFGAGFGWGCLAGWVVLAWAAVLRLEALVWPAPGVEPL